MKKFPNPNVQRGVDTLQPSHKECVVYDCMRGEDCEGNVHGMAYCGEQDGRFCEPCANHRTKNVGGEDASAVGCYANNSNASARTCNSNNAASNSNDNYAGAFAVNQGTETTTEHSTTWATSLNKNDGRTATGEYVRDEYDLPFMGEDKAESLAAVSLEGTIWEELKTANSKRKLKNLKRFICDEEIIRAGVDRCLKRASKSPQRKRAEKDRESIIKRLQKELTEETYRCQPPQQRVIHKRGKGDKDRNADIFSIYDRCVQNILLLVIERKMTNLIPRWCYSGIKGRSLYSNEKQGCMVNQIRTFVSRHKDASVGLTDIRHFYESLTTEVCIGVLFKTIVCPYTRRLLLDILSQTKTLPIGGTLSQLIAMNVLADMDRELHKKFHPQFYGTFGDNRIIMDTDRKKVTDAVHWEISYLKGRYNMDVKGDWQILRVKDGFMFCKQKFSGSFVHVRAELRRRAIRAMIKGQERYAGYKGFFLKTDSYRLRCQIEHDIHRLRKRRMKSKSGINIRQFQGDKIKLAELDGKKIIVTNATSWNNGRDSEYAVKMQILAKVKHKDGCEEKHLYVVMNGSYEIKEWYKLVEQGKCKLPCVVTVGCKNNSCYFKEYHVTNDEACDVICEDIDDDMLNQLD